MRKTGLAAKGAKVVLVPPEQSADLRDYFNKHTKTDKLDSRVLARLPLLHPEGLREVDNLGPAEALRRAVRHRSAIQRRRIQAMQRLDALVELLGPGYADVLGSGDYTKSALAVLERWGGPEGTEEGWPAPRRRPARQDERGHFGTGKAEELLAAADEAIALWEASGGLDFPELAQDIAAEARIVRALGTELAAIEERVGALYKEAGPTGIVEPAPGLGVTLAAGILGRTGDLDRFANLSGVRAFTGLVPKVDQSGLGDNPRGPTKTGDPGLRQALYMAADHARKVDPTLAERYHRLVVDKGKHQGSALCSVAPVLMSRIAACWRNGTRYELRDTDGRVITEDEGRAICAERYKVTPELRAKRRKASAAKTLKGRASRRRKESAEAAPASGPPEAQTSPHEAA